LLSGNRWSRRWLSFRISDTRFEKERIVQIQRDTKGQPFIEWQQAPGGFKRAWIQRKTDAEKDWACTPEGRYLNVVRVEALGAGPAGNATDFPIFSSLSDEQILLAFVASVSAITGCQLRE
jgi:hypothetical protein